MSWSVAPEDCTQLALTMRICLTKLYYELVCVTRGLYPTSFDHEKLCDQTVKNEEQEPDQAIP